MSDLIDNSPQCSSEDCTACSSVTLLLMASEKDLGGFVVRRLIERAKADWAEGRFAEVPGETEFIPLPTIRVRHD